MEGEDDPLELFMMMLTQAMIEVGELGAMPVTLDFTMPRMSAASMTQMRAAADAHPDVTVNPTPVITDGRVSGYEVEVKGVCHRVAHLAERWLEIADAEFLGREWSPSDVDAGKEMGVDLTKVFRPDHGLEG